MSAVTGIQRARFAIGGERGRDIDIARLLDISPAAVSRWNGVVPPNRAIEIEQKTNGRVTRYDIRPDYFGKVPPAAHKPKRKAA
jgi:DNA-binding transcriptional regulator YdaS (Cro superfamily)